MKDTVDDLREITTLKEENVDLTAQVERLREELEEAHEGSRKTTDTLSDGRVEELTRERDGLQVELDGWKKRSQVEKRHFD